jgi:hypothetical protein
MARCDEPLDKQVECAMRWQAVGSGLLSNRLRAVHLAREWLNGRKVGTNGFDSLDVPEERFKGMRLFPDAEGQEILPAARAYSYLDRYVSSDHGKDFPFQLTQPVLSGRRFFDMIDHYGNTYLPRKVFDVYTGGAADEDGADDADVALPYLKDSDCSDAGRDICKLMYDPEINRTRRGDSYCRILFHCAAMLYHDRFGTEKINEAFRVIYPWAFRMRIAHPARMTFAMVEDAAAGDMYGQRKELKGLVEGKGVGSGHLGLMSLIAMSPSPKAFLEAVDRTRVMTMPSYGGKNAGQVSQWNKSFNAYNGGRNWFRSPQLEEIGGDVSRAGSDVPGTGSGGGEE